MLERTLPMHDTPAWFERALCLLLVALILLIQWPLWLGHGGWLRVWDTEGKLAAQRQVNSQLEARNAALRAEVIDLRDGMEAAEERARYELGFISEGEIFVELSKDAASVKVNPARGVARR